MRLNSFTENVGNVLLYFFLLNITYTVAFAVYSERTAVTYVAPRSVEYYDAAAAGSYGHSLADVKVEKIRAPEKALEVGQYFEYMLADGKATLKYEVVQEYEHGFLIKGTADRSNAPNMIEEEFTVDKLTGRTTAVGYTSAVWNEYV